MNWMNFVFLETYCLKNSAENEQKENPAFCTGDGIPGYSCIRNNCPYLDFTSAENAFAYVGKDSSSMEEILLSEDDDLQLWETICRKPAKKSQ